MREINDLENLLSLVREQSVLVVAFYADWCGPCQEVKPRYAALSETYSTVMFCRCNIDRCRDCARQFNVRSIPMFIVWIAGEQHSTVNGPQIEALREIVDRAVVMRRPPAMGGVNLSTATPSHEQHTFSSADCLLVEKMGALARVVVSAHADPLTALMERHEACESIITTLEQDRVRRPFGVALLPYFASNQFSSAAVDALFAYIAEKPEPVRSDAEFIVNGMLSHLIEFFLSLTLSDTTELGMLHQVLYSLISCSSVLPFLVRSHLFCNNLFVNGLQLEYGTILGAMLGVSPYSRSFRPFPPYLRTVEWGQLLKMFPRSNDDHSKKISELQLCLQTSCAENKRIIVALLQAKTSREPTLRFIGLALRLNAGYSKTMHHHLQLSSRYFMTQLNDVLVEVSLPIFEKGCDFRLIPSTYLLEDPGDNVLVDFGSDVERITHYDQNRPLPQFPSLQEPFKPSVHLFFLSARSMTLSAAVLIETHERDEQDSVHPRVSPEQRAAYVAEKCLIEGLLGSEILGRKRVQVLNGIAAWLVRVIDASPDGTLSNEPPEEWQYLPQQLVDVVVRGVQLAPLDYFEVEHIISLMLVLMGNLRYFPKPHTHALFPSFLTRLLQNEETKRALTTHRWFTQHIVRSCVLCYIAVEKSTYEKVTVRYTLSYCTKSFLMFESLCVPVRKEFETDGTILERFSHMVTADVNEAVDQLIDTLTQMNRLVKEGADLSENANALRADTETNENNNSNNRDGTRARRSGRDRNNNNNEEAEGPDSMARWRRGENGEADDDDDDDDDDGESPLTYHQLGLGLRQRIHLFEASMDLFIQLAASFSKGVAQNMVAQQIGQMLARSLVSFAGADRKNLKIEYPERYNFRPREILGRLVDCFAQFRRFHNFLRSLCNCGVPLKELLQAMHTVADRGLVGEHLVWKLREIAVTLEVMSQEVHEDEALWDEAPEYALDVLLSTPLLHPVALPADVKDLNDLVYVNEDTIHHVLLSESKHPFTKEYLDEKMVKEFNAREDVAQARQELKDRIAAWLTEARQQRHRNAECIKEM